MDAGALYERCRERASAAGMEDAAPAIYRMVIARLEEQDADRRLREHG